MKQYDEATLTKCHVTAYDSLHRLCCSNLKLFLAGGTDHSTCFPPYPPPRLQPVTSCALRRLLRRIPSSPSTLVLCIGAILLLTTAGQGLLAR